jgi:hypothetical protein
VYLDSPSVVAAQIAHRRHILLSFLADRFDVDAVWINHERRIEVVMVIRPYARRAIIAAAMRYRGIIEGIDRSSGFCSKSDVDAVTARSGRRREATVMGQPKDRFSAGAIPMA